MPHGPHETAVSASLLQGHLAHKKTPPPRTTTGPLAQFYCWVLGGDVFLRASYPYVKACKPRTALVRRVALFSTSQRFLEVKDAHLVASLGWSSTPRQRPTVEPNCGGCPYSPVTPAVHSACAYSGRHAACEPSFVFDSSASCTGLPRP